MPDVVIHMEDDYGEELSIQNVELAEAKSHLEHDRACLCFKNCDYRSVIFLHNTIIGMSALIFSLVQLNDSSLECDLSTFYYGLVTAIVTFIMPAPPTRI
jgi:hypothetical protein